jgi:predicted exporter
VAENTPGRRVFGMSRPSKESAVSQALTLVAPAETAFTSRWRLTTLQRLDADLYARIQEQQDLYDSAMLKGTDDEVREQSAAMVRGWRAACQRMERPLQPDDAYLVGHDPTSFTRVVIGHHTQSAARTQYVEGQTTIFVTPDEVAALFTSMTALRTVKALFPDAEIMEVTPSKKGQDA